MTTDTELLAALDRNMLRFENIPGCKTIAITWRNTTVGDLVTWGSDAHYEFEVFDRSDVSMGAPSESLIDAMGAIHKLVPGANLAFSGDEGTSLTEALAAIGVSAIDAMLAA